MRGKIYTASERGFCSGVERAIELVEKALRNGPLPVRVLHEIVHNEHVVRKFREQGVEFVDEPNPAWNNGTLIFSAHGASGKIEDTVRKMNVTFVDATCPLVKGIHRTAAKLEQEGFRIILLGKRSHREIEGVIGRLKTPPVVLESKEDALNFSPEPNAGYACLTQTTLSEDDCTDIFEILRSKIPGIRIQSGICSATTARQKAVKELAKKCSQIIVIGSAQSSNSRKLRKVAEAGGARAILISSADELPEDFLKDGDVGITSGASAPEYLLQDTIRKLTELGWKEDPSKDRQ